MWNFTTQPWFRCVSLRGCFFLWTWEGICFDGSPSGQRNGWNIQYFYPFSRGFPDFPMKNQGFPEGTFRQIGQYICKSASATEDEGECSHFLNLLVRTMSMGPYSIRWVRSFNHIESELRWATWSAVGAVDHCHPGSISNDHFVQFQHHFPSTFHIDLQDPSSCYFSCWLSKRGHNFTNLEFGDPWTVFQHEYI